MSLLAPNQGKKAILDAIMAPATVANQENLTLKLFKTNYVPTVTDTSGSYTESTFTGYAAKTLTRDQSAGHWSASTSANPAVTSYGGGTPLSWNATSAESCYGYFIVGATSGTVYWAENFGAISLTSNSTLQLTPQLTLT